MTKKSKNPKNMTRSELSDAIFHVGFKMATGDMLAKRAALLCSALSLSVGERPPICLGLGYCERLSCPPCRGGGQRGFLLKGLPWVDGLRKKADALAITIIPEFAKTAVGELPKGGLRGFKNQIRAAIRKVVPDAVGVMSVDVSVERTVGNKEYWQWHVHGIICDLQDDALDQLRQRFSWGAKGDTNGTCYRPVQVKKLRDRFGWLAYMAKPNFFMREQRSDATGDLKFSKKPITVEQELHFVKALSKSKVKERFFYIGMDQLETARPNIGDGMLL